MLVMKTLSIITTAFTVLACGEGANPNAEITFAGQTIVVREYGSERFAALEKILEAEATIVQDWTPGILNEVMNLTLTVVPCSQLLDGTPDTYGLYDHDGAIAIRSCPATRNRAVVHELTHRIMHLSGESADSTVHGPQFQTLFNYQAVMVEEMTGLSVQ